MSRNSFLFFLISFLSGFWLTGCGVAESSLPAVLPRGDSSFTYGLTVIQTNKQYQIGDEFILTPTFKSSWGIGNEIEVSLKTFGLGLGGEIRYEFFRKKFFAASIGGEGDFSFPMMGYLTSRFLPVNQDFLNFVSNAFYFGGAKIVSGFIWDKVIVALSVKGGYLDNAGFLPDMGTTASSSYPGFLCQTGLGFFFRESRFSNVSLGLEWGFLAPLSLLYISGNYHF